MSKFIQVDDINGTQRFVNVKHIAFIEPEGVNCKVVMKMKGRDEYLNFAFLTKQTFDEVKSLIIGDKK